jgi:hypothetical protein
MKIPSSASISDIPAVKISDSAMIANGGNRPHGGGRREAEQGHLSGDGCGPVGSSRRCPSLR